ncbi:hypothetical protein ACLMJK_009411 [Lecanora helva]
MASLGLDTLPHPQPYLSAVGPAERSPMAQKRGATTVSSMHSDFVAAIPNVNLIDELVVGSGDKQVYIKDPLSRTDPEIHYDTLSATSDPPATASPFSDNPIAAFSNFSSTSTSTTTASTTSCQFCPSDDLSDANDGKKNDRHNEDGCKQNKDRTAIDETSVLDPSKRMAEDAGLNTRHQCLPDSQKVRRKDQSVKLQPLYTVFNGCRKTLPTMQMTQTMTVSWHEFARNLSLSLEFRRLHGTRSKARIQQTQVDPVRLVTIRVSAGHSDPLSGLLSNLFQRILSSLMAMTTMTTDPARMAALPGIRARSLIPGEKQRRPLVQALALPYLSPSLSIVQLCSTPAIIYTERRRKRSQCNSGGQAPQRQPSTALPTVYGSKSRA